MEYNYNKLRGRIIEKFGTQGKFAEALNVTENTVSRKMNDSTGFSKEDISRWCNVLEIDNKDIGAYFFTLKV